MLLTNYIFKKKVENTACFDKNLLLLLLCNSKKMQRFLREAKIKNIIRVLQICGPTNHNDFL